jgi:hypothetical protein
VSGCSKRPTVAAMESVLCSKAGGQWPPSNPGVWAGSAMIPAGSILDRSLASKSVEIAHLTNA